LRAAASSCESALYLPSSSSRRGPGFVMSLFNLKKNRTGFYHKNCVLFCLRGFQGRLAACKTLASLMRVFPKLSIHFTIVQLPGRDEISPTRDHSLPCIPPEFFGNVLAAGDA